MTVYLLWVTVTVNDLTCLLSVKKTKKQKTKLTSNIQQQRWSYWFMLDYAAHNLYLKKNLRNLFCCQNETSPKLDSYLFHGNMMQYGVDFK